MLLVLDDLQWVDERTIELLGSLADGFLADRPLMILGTYRVGETNRALEVLLERAPCHRVDRLDAGTLAVMVGDMLALDDVPARLVETLFRESEGNPFFVIEYLRAAVQEGWLTRRPGCQWQVEVPERSAGDRLAVPSSLSEIMDRRLARLSADARALADVAAVVGRWQRPAILAAASGSTESALMDQVSELTARDVLEVDGRGDLRFSHDKIRERLYHSLAAERRRALHATVAQALEAEGGAGGERRQALERAEDLARHWAEASEPARAHPWSLEAARLAMDSYQFAHAADLYGRAIRLAEAAGLAVPPDVVERLGDACLQGGRYDDAIACFRTCAGAGTSAMARAELLRKSAEVEHRRGNTLAAGEQIEAVLATLGVQVPRSRWSFRLRAARLFLGFLGRLLLGRDTTPAPATASESDRLLTRACMRAAEIWYTLDLSRAMFYNVTGLQVARRLGRSPELAINLAQQCPALCLIGLRRLAFRLIERARAMLDPPSPVDGATMGVIHGLCLAFLGRARECEQETRESVRLLEQAREPLKLRQAIAFRTEMLLSLGAVDLAEQQATELLRLSEELADDRGRGWALGLLGIAASRSGRQGEASILLRASIDCLASEGGLAFIGTQGRQAFVMALHGEIDEALPIARDAAIEWARGSYYHSTAVTDGAFLATAALKLRRDGRLDAGLRRDLWRVKVLRRGNARVARLSAPLYYAGLGALAAASGRLRRGRALFARALAQAERNGLTGDACDVHALAARVLPEPERSAHEARLRELRARFPELSRAFAGG